MNFSGNNVVYYVDVMAGRPPTKEATDFGKQVALARHERGLTQQELADRIGVTRHMIDYYERRATNVKTEVVVKLAAALNVSTDTLLGRQEVRPKPGPKSLLRRRLEDVERLPRHAQKQITTVVDALIAQHSSGRANT